MSVVLSFFGRYVYHIESDTFMIQSFSNSMLKGVLTFRKLLYREFCLRFGLDRLLGNFSRPANCVIE